MKTKEMIQVPGRGTIISIEYEDGDTLHKIGDRIYYDGHEYNVTGIEKSRLMMNPPKWDSKVGLLVTQRS